MKIKAADAYVAAAVVAGLGALLLFAAYRTFASWRFRMGLGCSDPEERADLRSDRNTFLWLAGIGILCFVLGTLAVLEATSAIPSIRSIWPDYMQDICNVRGTATVGLIAAAGLYVYVARPFSRNKQAAPWWIALPLCTIAFAVFQIMAYLNCKCPECSS